MKSRHSTPPRLVTRWCLSTFALLLGAGLVFLAIRAAGSFPQVLENIQDGVPSAAGFVPFVLGVICLIYGLVGLVFRRDDHDED